MNILLRERLFCLQHNRLNEWGCAKEKGGLTQPFPPWSKMFFSSFEWIKTGLNKSKECCSCLNLFLCCFFRKILHRGWNLNSPSKLHPIFVCKRCSRLLFGDFWGLLELLQRGTFHYHPTAAGTKTTSNCTVVEDHRQAGDFFTYIHGDDFHWAQWLKWVQCTPFPLHRELFEADVTRAFIPEPDMH